jgi:murein DD-endopeptidase MepM/ murein hydrolase activator NlpD
MDDARAQVRAQNRQGFSAGTGQTPAPRPLATIDGVGLVPFEPGSGAVITSARGQRGGRHHAGIDIGVPGDVEGTPIVAVTAGKVSFVGVLPGYGNTIIIDDGNGHDQLYAHLNTLPTLEVGAVVGQGQRIGGMGDSGVSYGAHLHFEVRTAGGAAGTDVDAEEYLRNVRVQQGAAQSDRGLGLPPTQTVTNSEWQVNATALPSNGAIPIEVSNSPPEGAYVLSNGSYIHNGTIYYPDEQSASEARSRRTVRTTAYSSRRVPGQVQQAPVSDVITNTNPMRGVLAASDRASYPTRNDRQANYGYRALAEDHAFRNKLAQVADELDIPAQWLADVMAFETGGTFDPAKSNNVSDYNNGVGCVGLIQFCYLGATGARAAQAMTRTEQLDMVRDYFMESKGQMRTVYDVWAGVWAGMAYSRDGGGEEIAMSEIGDGFTTGTQYSRRLGEHAGRRYAHPGDRGDSTIHSSPVNGCATCQSLQQSGSFAAHVAR